MTRDPKDPNATPAEEPGWVQRQRQFIRERTSVKPPVPDAAAAKSMKKGTRGSGGAKDAKLVAAPEAAAEEASPAQIRRALMAEYRQRLLAQRQESAEATGSGGGGTEGGA
jgi:hypothetical protein